MGFTLFTFLPPPERRTFTEPFPGLYHSAAPQHCGQFPRVDGFHPGNKRHHLTRPGTRFYPWGELLNLSRANLAHFCQTQGQIPGGASPFTFLLGPHLGRGGPFTAKALWPLCAKPFSFLQFPNSTQATQGPRICLGVVFPPPDFTTPRFVQPVFIPHRWDSRGWSPPLFYRFSPFFWGLSPSFLPLGFDIFSPAAISLGPGHTIGPFGFCTCSRGRHATTLATIPQPPQGGHTLWVLGPTSGGRAITTHGVSRPQVSLGARFAWGLLLFSGAPSCRCRFSSRPPLFRAPGSFPYIYWGRRHRVLDVSACGPGFLSATQGSLLGAWVSFGGPSDELYSNAGLRAIVVS